MDDEEKYRELRWRMVDEQIARRGVRDERVLAAMRAVPRHVFVPCDYRDRAYGDHPLSIGEGQTISQPYVVAGMTEQLGLQGHERVLEIGSGCGYQTAILARLCARVYAIEYFPSLAATARATLEDLGVDNVELRVGDGNAGWAEAAPFDAVLAAAAAPAVPRAWTAQLAPGGRMILPLGDDVQILTLVEKDDSGTRTKELYGVRFVPLLGAERA